MENVADNSKHQVQISGFNGRKAISPIETE